MKLRHAAALALVGWYLMTPPVYPVNKFQQIDPTGEYGMFNTSAPLSQWVLGPAFDTAAQCEKARRTAWKKAWAELPSLPGVSEGNPPKILDTYKAAQLEAVCVATDDPRLKEK